MESSLTIKKGSIDLCYVFEVGEGIKLDHASELIQKDTRKQLTSKKGSPERYFGYDPAPLITSEVTEPFQFSHFTTDRSFELTLFDIGVVLARYKIILDEGTPFSSLIDLSIALGRDVRLQLDARSRVESMLDKIAPSVTRPYLEDISQGYFLYGIESFLESTGENIPYVIETHAGIITQILRQEDRELSEDIIADVLKYKISYTPFDITIVDWDSAIRLGSESKDIFDVIEFALVQLLEMLYLDEKIDDHNDAAYEVFSANESRGPFKRLFMKYKNALSGRFKTSEAELAQLTVDSTSLAINVSSAINLIGDPTLVKIYELASDRFRLAGLESVIDRKIAVLEGIYQKYTDRANARRSMILELVIIILIAFEVYQGFFKI